MSDSPGIVFIDVSSNNPLPDLAAYKAEGHQIIAIKATEGNGYVWSEGLTLANQARSLGLHVWLYHFARPGITGEAQAEWFLGHMSAFDVLVLDLEGDGWAHGEANQVAADFCGTVTTKTGKTGYLYSGYYFLNDNGVAQPRGWQWWVASYTGSLPPIPPGWTSPGAWQFTDNAVDGAETSPVDESRLLKVPTPTQGDDEAMLSPQAEAQVDAIVKKYIYQLGTTVEGTLNPDGSPKDPTHVSLRDIKHELDTYKASTDAKLDAILAALNTNNPPPA